MDEMDEDKAVLEAKAADGDFSIIRQFDVDCFSAYLVSDRVRVGCKHKDYGQYARTKGEPVNELDLDADQDKDYNNEVVFDGLNENGVDVYSADMHSTNKY